uniref:CHAT domain-containing protein n=1 Tax=Roseivirga sp. TaxID=1964215 RepID=UPI00404833F7
MKRLLFICLCLVGHTLWGQEITNQHELFFDELLQKPENVQSQVLSFGQYKNVAGKAELFAIYEATESLIREHQEWITDPNNSGKIPPKHESLLKDELFGQKGRLASPQYNYYLFGAVAKALEGSGPILNKTLKEFWGNYLFSHFLTAKWLLAGGTGEGGQEMMWLEEVRTAMLSYKPSKTEFYRKLVLTLLYPEYFSALAKEGVPAGTLKTAKEAPLIYTFNYGEFDFETFKINRGQTKRYCVFKYSGNSLSYSSLDFTQDTAIELFNEYSQLVLENKKLDQSILEVQVWRPIENLIEGHNKFYFYPDGILKGFGLLSLDGAFNSSINIAPHYILTDQSFFSTKTNLQISKGKLFAVFANPAYEVEPGDLDGLTDTQLELYQYAKGQITPVQKASLVKRGEGNSPQLKSVEDEARVLRQILQENDWQGSTFMAQEATEYNIKQLQSPQVLHIASHYGRQDLSPNLAPTEETLNKQNLFMNAISDMKNAYDSQSREEIQGNAESNTEGMEVLVQRLLSGEIDSVSFNNRVDELSQNQLINMYSELDELVKQQMIAAGEDTSGFVGMYDAIFNPEIIAQASQDWDNDPMIRNMLGDHDNGILMWGADEMIEKANHAYMLYEKYGSMDALNKEDVTLDEIKATGILQEINAPNINDVDSLQDYISEYFENVLSIGMGGYLELYSDSGVENLDSILSVNDIVGLDLKGTELVTLSGCSSGVAFREGDTKSGYAEYFRMAGARVVLASLWDVNDQATAMLMTRFYNYWLAGKGMAESLLFAQKDLSQVQGFESPFFWSGWLLYGYQD